MRVAILSDGKPGHFNQSLGIANIISEDIEVDYEVFKIQPRNKLLRFLLKPYQRFLVRDFNNTSAKKIIKLFKPINIEGFDLVISSGANTAYLSAAICKIYKIKNIHSGSIKKINLINYSAHITVEPKSDSPNNIVTKIAPTRFRPSDLSRKEKHNKILFLIGGNGAGYTYTIEDWQDLVKSIKNISNKSRVIPILVTSRRTQINHEEFLYSQLIDLADDLSIWTNRNNTELDLNMLFNSVDNIFVTEESATMTAEAISSGLPVFTLCPRNANPTKLFLDQLKRYVDMNLLQRMYFHSDLSEVDPIEDISSKVVKIRDNLKKQILYRIK